MDLHRQTVSCAGHGKIIFNAAFLDHVLADQGPDAIGHFSDSSKATEKETQLIRLESRRASNKDYVKKQSSEEGIKLTASPRSMDVCA